MYYYYFITIVIYLSKRELLNFNPFCHLLVMCYSYLEEGVSDIPLVRFLNIIEGMDMYTEVLKELSITSTVFFS